MKMTILFAICLTIGSAAMAVPTAALWADAPPQVAAEANATPTPSKLFLPSVSTYASPTPTATPINPPPPSTIYVANSRMYWNGPALHVVGELGNSRWKLVCSVKVNGKFYDASGGLVATGYGVGMLTGLMPQQQVPFDIEITNAPASIVRYELNVVWNNLCSNYRLVTVVSQNIRDNHGAEIFGEVRNDTAATLGVVTVAVSFYDAAGNLWDADVSFATDRSLGSGQTTTYRINTGKLDLLTLPYMVQGEGSAP